mmetsp:Transcript_2131/g.13955  ORF Transcript_2131/g.13955 Transcript_2131/m.13955 type:complete len:275 (+) Transcript_2131:5323-6147(+)
MQTRPPWESPTVDDSIFPFVIGRDHFQLSRGRLALAVLPQHPGKPDVHVMSSLERHDVPVRQARMTALGQEGQVPDQIQDLVSCSFATRVSDLVFVVPSITVCYQRRSFHASSDESCIQHRLYVILAAERARKANLFQVGQSLRGCPAVPLVADDGCFGDKVDPTGDARGGVRVQRYEGVSFLQAEVLIGLQGQPAHHFPLVGLGHLHPRFFDGFHPELGAPIQERHFGSTFEFYPRIVHSARFQCREQVFHGGQGSQSRSQRGGQPRLFHHGV